MNARTKSSFKKVRDGGDGTQTVLGLEAGTTSGGELPLFPSVPLPRYLIKKILHFCILRAQPRAYNPYPLPLHLKALLTTFSLSSPPLTTWSALALRYALAMCRC